MTAVDAARWHDVECAAYGADLDIWDSLARGAAGPLLELGAGTGRVTLELAARGHAVTALDDDPELLGALRGRATERGLSVETVEADARDFALGSRRFALCIAPMQVVQLLGGGAGREAMLTAVRRRLDPGATFAAAVVEPPLPIASVARDPQLPDVREHDGFVYSSTPVSVAVETTGTIVVERLRELVSPDGGLEREQVEIMLDPVTPKQLIAEAERHGFGGASVLAIPATDLHLGSSVVVLEAI